MSHPSKRKDQSRQNLFFHLSTLQEMRREHDRDEAELTLAGWGHGSSGRVSAQN
jgi:hypothetical protein